MSRRAQDVQRRDALERRLWSGGGRSWDRKGVDVGEEFAPNDETGLRIQSDQLLGRGGDDDDLPKAERISDELEIGRRKRRKQIVRWGGGGGLATDWISFFVFRRRKANAELVLQVVHEGDELFCLVEGRRMRKNEA